MDQFSDLAQWFARRRSKSLMRGMLPAWAQIALDDQRTKDTSLIQAVSDFGFYINARSEIGNAPMQADATQHFMALWPRSGLPAERLILAALLSRDFGIASFISSCTRLDFDRAAEPREIEILRQLTPNNAASQALKSEASSKAAIPTFGQILDAMALHLGHGADEVLACIRSHQESFELSSSASNPSASLSQRDVRL